MEDKRPTLFQLYQHKTDREIIKYNEDGSIVFYDKKLNMVMRTMNYIERLQMRGESVLETTIFEANTATENSDIISKSDVPYNVDDFVYRKNNVLYVIGFPKPNQEAFTSGQKLAHHYSAQYVSLDIFINLGHKKAFSKHDLVDEYHQDLLWEYVKTERKSTTFLKGLDPEKDKKTISEEMHRLVRWLNNKHQRMVIEGVALVPALHQHPELTKNCSFLFKSLPGDLPQDGRPNMEDFAQVLFAAYRMYRGYMMINFLFGNDDEEEGNDEENSEKDNEKETDGEYDSNKEDVDQNIVGGVKNKMQQLSNHFITQPLSESTYLGIELKEVIEMNNRYSTKTNIFFSEKDIYCNMERFKKGEVNIVFVTGFSGSGKSTLARRFAVKTESIYVELDSLIYRGMRRPFTREWCYDEMNRAEILWLYIEEKKKPLDFMMKYKNPNDPGVLREVYEYIQWLETKPTTPSTYIIEGIDLTQVIPMNPDWYNYPIIFKGTSMVTSMVRKLRRDGIGSAKIKNIDDAIAFVKELIGWYNQMSSQQDGLRSNMILGDPDKHVEMDDNWVKEDLIPVGQAVLEVSSSTKGNLIPVDYSNYKVPGTRVLCLNTHVLNVIDESVPLVGFMTIIEILRGGSPLLLLADYATFAAWSIADQIFAVDFVSVNKDIEITNDLQGYPVVAINDGIVVDIQNGRDNEMSNIDRMLRKYGNYVVLKHDDGRKFYSLYAHLEKGSIRAKIGDKIKRGMYLGRVGHSGNSDASQSHLHFEMLYTNIMAKHRPSLLLDIPKMRDGFAPYKCTKIPFVEVAKIWVPYNKIEGVKQAFLKPMSVDRSGELSGACFLTEATEILESYKPTFEAAKYLHRKVTFAEVQKKMYFIADPKGINNSVFEIDGEKYRVRVETIVRRKIKGQDMVFFEKRDEVSHYGSTYKIPGGSTEPKLTMAQQAEAECNEEILVNVKNVHYTGKYYIVKYDEATIPEWHKKILWPMGCKYVGAITFVFSADYAGPYRKEVVKEDQDSLVKKGDWYPIQDFKARAIKYHQGINLKISNESMTHFVTESSPGYIEPETTFDDPETFSYGADDAVLELQRFVDRNNNTACKFKLLKIGISTCIGTVCVPRNANSILDAIRFCRKATNASDRFNYYISGRTENEYELLLHFNPKKKVSVDEDFSTI